MSYNPNKAKRYRTWLAIEKLYESLRSEGIRLKGIELSKPLANLTEGEKPLQTITMSRGPGFNRVHIKVNVSGSKRKV